MSKFNKGAKRFSQIIYYVYISYEANSDKFYIGSSKCHCSPNKHKYLGSGSAIKSGEFKPNYKWVYGTYKTRQEAGLAEMELIKQADYKHNPLCMNKLCAGAGQNEAKYKNSCKAFAGKNNPMYGKKHSEETKAKLSKKAKGRKFSIETRAKISEAGKCRKHTEKAKAKIREANSGINNYNYGKASHLRDTNLHKFVHESGKEIIGLYYELKAKAKELFGFSASSVQNLKTGKVEHIKGWQYAGIID